MICWVDLLCCCGKLINLKTPSLRRMVIGESGRHHIHHCIVEMEASSIQSEVDDDDDDNNNINTCMK